MNRHAMVWRMARRAATVCSLALAVAVLANGIGGRPTASAQTAAVSIVDLAFQPNTLTVPVGTTVTWTNNGNLPHTTTSTGNWDSGVLNRGGTFSRQFTQAGTFNYLCTIHPNMTGTITVQAGAATGTATAAAVAATATPTRTATPAPTTAAPAAAPQTGGVTRTVLTGAQDLPGISINHFGPAEIRIPQGGTVTWRNPNIEPHTVSFGMPRLVGSGTPISPADIARVEELLAPNPQTSVTYTGGPLNSGFEMGTTFSVTFPNAGTYTYLCVIHPGMDGTVVVVPSGQTVPSQAEVDATAQQEFQPLLAAARAERDRLRTQAVRSEARPDGTTIYRVLSGREIPKTDINLFFPEAVTPREGDTVTWESAGFTPHTITFGELPAMQGPPPAEFFTGFRQTGPYTGGFAHSGFLGNGMPAGQTYSLTFGRAGTYNYVCILHAEQGMIGRVTVSPRAAAPAPTAPTPAPAIAPVPPPAPGVTAPPVVQLPRTGSGSALAAGEARIGGAVLLAVLATGTGFVLRRRAEAKQ